MVRLSSFDEASAGEGRQTLDSVEHGRDGVEHGSLLAGRYRLQKRVRAGVDGSLWRAVDETLERPVSVRVVRPGHQYTADVLDAARRASLVEDTRLVRVLNVGESEGSAYIVSEHLVGRTIKEMLVSGPLPHQTARRLIGEAAEALDRASARGLHHLQLTPSSLVITRGGTVKVLGTAVEAALTGVERHGDPRGADRSDTVGLVRVLYTALTGRWPGHIDGPLDPTSPSTGRVIPPGDLVDGIPNDLDRLCTTTLGPHDDGPRSPGELAQQLAPWLPGEPPPPRNPTRASRAATGLNHPGQQASAPPAGRAAGRGPVTTRNGGTAPASRASAPKRTTTATPPAGSGTPPAGRDVTSGPEPPTTKPPTTEPPTTEPPTTEPPAAEPPAAEPPSTVEPTAADDAVEGEGKPLGPAAQTDDWTILSRSAPSSGAPQKQQSEPLGPFIPPAPLSRPPTDQTRLVLALVAGLVTLGLILAVVSLRGVFGSTGPLVQSPLIPVDTPSSANGSTTSPPLPASGAPSGTSTAGSPTPSGDLPDLIGTRAIDPQGDGDENNSTSDRVLDGNLSTDWHSARYQTARFGGLKQGLGVFLQTTGGPIRSVTVQMSGLGGTVELRTTNGPGLDGSATVAIAQHTTGPVVITPTTPVTNGPLLLWFTELPQQSSGEYRLVIHEITIS